MFKKEIEKHLTDLKSGSKELIQSWDNDLSEEEFNQSASPAGKKAFKVFRVIFIIIVAIVLFFISNWLNLFDIHLFGNSDTKNLQYKKYAPLAELTINGNLKDDKTYDNLTKSSWFFGPSKKDIKFLRYSVNPDGSFWVTVTNTSEEYVLVKISVQSSSAGHDVKTNIYGFIPPKGNTKLEGLFNTKGSPLDTNQPTFEVEKINQFNFDKFIEKVKEYKDL